MTNRWRTRITDDVIARRRAAGEWSDTTLAQHLDRLVASRPDQLLVVDRDVHFTAQQLHQSALALVAAIQARGIAAGDVISFQLPNWNEAVLIELACAYGGFVCNPIVQIYRDAEVQHIVRDARSRILFVPQVFRRFDYVSMVDRIETAWDGVTETVVVRPDSTAGRSSFEAFIEAGRVEPSLPAVDPNDIKLLMYTSGTTGPAKGVLHTHNTIGAEIANFIRYLALDSGDVVLMPSPLGHITGYLYGIQLPVTLGCPVVLMDAWEVGAAAELIDRFKVTFTIGATPFLQELASFAAANGRPLSSLRYFPSGGAPVPPEVIYRANTALANCTAFRLYGSTEAPTVTLGVPDRARAELAAETEGFVVGHEIVLTGQDGNPVPPGEEGEIRTRGGEVCVGYADYAENAKVFDENGYFRTGDLARMTPEGCLVITGRSKDLIIRGGENISPKEIEDVLHAHPAVDVAAVVGMPHARLGETGCAFVTLKRGQNFDFADMERALVASGMARQKFPERLEIVADLPYTAAGKIRKNLLRDRICDMVRAEWQVDGEAAPKEVPAGPAN